MHLTVRHTARMPRLAAVALILAAVGLAESGCGRQSGAAVPGGSSVPGTTTATSVAAATSTLGAGSSSGQPVHGQVTLTLNKSQYAPQDPLLVTVHNGLDTPIWARDMHSGCSVIVIERLVQATWQPLEPCAGRRPPQMVPVQAGAALAQRIDFAAGAALDDGGGWPAGTYRATLTYTLSQSAAEADAGTTVHSAEFTIQ